MEAKVLTTLRSTAVSTWETCPRPIRRMGFTWDADRTVCQRGYTPHVPRKANKAPKPKHRRGKARRWKVERTHSWLNRARRLLIRWEKKVANYLGFLQLQFAIVTLRTAAVLG